MNATRRRPRLPLVATLALAGLLAAPSARAQSKTGTTLGQFILIEPSARVTAMGNAGVTLFDGLDAAWYNPAAIGRELGHQFVFSHGAWFADITHDYVAASLPAGRWGNVYASVTSLGSGPIEVRTVSQPLGTGESYSVSDIAIVLGFGRMITDRFSVGLQTTWLQETIWHSSASTMTVGVGTLYRVSENGLAIGASLSNFGTAGKFDGRDLRILYDNDPSRNGDNGALPGERFTDPFAVPVMFRLGAGLPVRIGPAHVLRFALDAFHPSDNTESVSAGAEWAWRDRAALRAGWQNAFQKDTETGPTMGAGLGGKLDAYTYRLDYAWADHGRLGSIQRFALLVTF